MGFQLQTEFEAGSEGGESQYLNQPGTYHCVVTRAMDGEGPKGGQIDGFTAVLSVLAGTVEGQEDKETSLVLFSPDPNGTEKSQKWARAKQTAFAVATDLIDLKNKAANADIDLDEAVGRQLIVTLELNDYNGKSNLQVAYANIYHVDDPRAKKFPKSDEALSLIPEALRHGADYFEENKAPAPGSQPAKRAPKLSNSELADL